MTNEELAKTYYLLEIAEKAVQHGGKLSSLGGWAIGELIAINEGIRLESVAKAKAEKDKTAAETASRNAGINPEDDHQVDLDLGAPRANPPVEHGGNGRRL